MQDKNKREQYIIERLQDLLENSTGGRWYANGDGISSDLPAADYDEATKRFLDEVQPDTWIAQDMWDRDAEFVAATRNLLPELLALAQEALALRAELKAQLEARIQEAQEHIEYSDDFGSWIHNDESHQTTIEAMQALLKKYNLEGDGQDD